MQNIRSFLGAAGVAAVAALGMSTAAHADDERKFGYSITIAGTSDYVFRGLSFNNEDPAFQPFIEFTYGNDNLTWYLNFWGSNISGVGYSPYEMDITGGARFVTGPVSWDLGVLYYTYPSNTLGWSATDYVEFKIAASVTPMTNLSTGLTVFYTPDQGSNYGETWTIEGNAGYELPEFHGFTPSITGAIGYSEGEDGFSPCACGTDNYTYWNAGLKLSIDKYFMDFRYWDTDISNADGAKDFADSRFVFSAGVNLP